MRRVAVHDRTRRPHRHRAPATASATGTGSPRCEDLHAEPNTCAAGPARPADGTGDIYRLHSLLAHTKRSLTQKIIMRISRNIVYDNRRSAFMPCAHSTRESRRAVVGRQRYSDSSREGSRSSAERASICRGQDQHQASMQPSETCGKDMGKENRTVPPSPRRPLRAAPRRSIHGPIGT